MAPTIQTYGVTLPITHGPLGYFNQSTSSLEQINSNLRLLLLTKKGERRMSPNFGSGTWNVLFQNITDNIGPIIESSIRSDVLAWMPYLTVQTVSTAANQNNPNELDVSVSFTVPSIGIMEPQTLQVAMNTNNVS